MKIATYNVRSADHGKSIDAIKKEVADLGIQIIGFQELDNKAHRSGNVNVLEEMCREVFPYYEYAAAMEFDGGYYGIGMASVYPMKLVRSLHYETAEHEPRVLMICEVDVNGKKIYAANTHLSYEDYDVRMEQMNVIEKELSCYAPIILFGDFNVNSFDEYEPISLNRVNNPQNPMTSFKTGGCIDNIFYSNDFNVLKTEINDSESSDHNMIWAEVEFAE